jgi:rhomboid protease GluP
MIIDKIRAKLTSKGFQESQVNVKGIYLFYHAIDKEISIISIFDSSVGSEYTAEQYKNINSQLYKNYSDRGFISIRMQTIICTNHVEVVRKLQSYDRNEWIIDMVSGKLIIYENQNADFMGIRSDIEEVLLSIQISNMGTNHFPYSSNDNTGNPYGDTNNPYDNTGNPYGNTGNPYGNTNNPYGNMYNPMKQSVWTKYFAKCNTFLVLINVLVFFVIERNITSVRTNAIIDAGALYWPAIKYSNEYYRLFTYMFLHGGIEHLANNMIVLLIIGDNMERAAGKWRYMIIYFGSGVIAGIASMSYNMVNNMNTVSIGASGAIFGVVGAMAYIVAVNKGRLEDISTRQIILFVVFSLYGGMTSQGVDNAAHIGGLLAGIVLAAILYRKHKKNEPERG